MSLERGTRRGGPRPQGPPDGGARIVLAAGITGVVLLAAIVLGVGALILGGGPRMSPSHDVSASVMPTPAQTHMPTPTPSPTRTSTPTPSPTRTSTPTPSPTRTPRPTAGDGDPDDLPRYPGSRLVERRAGRSGDLRKLELAYRTSARLDQVRRHYRVMLRRNDWFVADVEFDDDGWEIEANKGQREASIELERSGSGTAVEIAITWPAEREDR